MALVIENLYKTFEGYAALDRINLTVDKAEFVCLLVIRREINTQ